MTEAASSPFQSRYDLDFQFGDQPAIFYRMPGCLGSLKPLQLGRRLDDIDQVGAPAAGSAGPARGRTADAGCFSPMPVVF
jgi:hypothetical protein